MNKIQLTEEGLKKLQSEYEEMKDLKRPQTLERLQKARAMGDLSENSEYSAAKEELAFVDGRLLEIETILNQAQIVQGNGSNGSEVVGVGSTVTVKTTDKTENFSIVGEYEADPMNKKLSHASPLGRALIGKKVGDIVAVEAPAGTISYTVLSIS